MNISKKSSWIILLYLLTFMNAAFSQPGEWVWIKGTNNANDLGNLGTQGVSSPANYPCAMKQTISWTDLDGNFWLFGGYNKYNLVYADLWKYEPATNQWTWMKGDHQSFSAGNYGIQGVADSANNPSSRFGGGAWADNQGNLWLFGGIRSAGNVYSDLWKFDISLNMWIWVKGPNTIAQPGVYGNIGVPSIQNNPSARHSFASWTDNSGDLWLFGGIDGSYKNDLWRYNIASNMWTWMKGSSTMNPPPLYGTKGIESNSNVPGGTESNTMWRDVNGNFWMFGGWGSSLGYINQLWRFNVSSNNWTWMSGDSTANYSGSYGSVCVDSVTNVPRSMKSSTATWNDNQGNLLFYGGYHYSGPGLSDFWKYCLSGNNWTLQRPNGGVNWGTMGVSAPTNTPGFRSDATSWKDGNGNLYLFGGQDSLGQTYNDLWKFVLDTTCGNCIPTVGFSEVHNSNDHISVFPNPVSDMCTIKFIDVIKNGNITVLNLLGKIVLQKNILESESTEIHVRDFSKGMYVIRVINGKNIYSKKFVVE